MAYLHPTYIIWHDLLLSHFGRKPLTILDYGCGNGALLATIPKQMISSYTGFDVNSAGLAVARKKYREKIYRFSIFTAGEIPTLGRVDSYDLVILIGVLQYMTDEEINVFLTKAYQSLKPGGILAISCVGDHAIYRFTNFYQLFFRNRYLNRHDLNTKITNLGFKIIQQFERGLIIGPLFSHGLVILFDALDKLIFHNRGKLGPIGSWARQAALPFMNFECKIPLDYGYTLYVMAQK